VIFRRRSRFGDVIERQLELFRLEQAGLIAECDECLARYNAAEADEAEELYGDYLDRVALGTEALAEMRNAYAKTLGGDAREEYEAEFDATVTKKLPPFGIEIDAT
jgi:hypothetical protein